MCRRYKSCFFASLQNKPFDLTNDFFVEMVSLLDVTPDWNCLATWFGSSKSEDCGGDDCVGYVVC